MRTNSASAIDAILRDRFGGRRAFARHIGAKVLLHSGMLRKRLTP